MTGRWGALRRAWGEGVKPLAYVKEGSTVEVVYVIAGRGLARRLAEMGITQGAILKVLRSMSPGPVVVESVNRGGALPGWNRIALGYGVARKVMVREIGEGH